MVMMPSPSSEGGGIMWQLFPGAGLGTANGVGYILLMECLVSM